MITDLKEKSLSSSNALNIREQSFSGLTCDILDKSRFPILLVILSKNISWTKQDRNPNGFRHNEEAKKFAVSLHYSPAAYEYVRSVFALPVSDLSQSRPLLTTASLDSSSMYSIKFNLRWTKIQKISQVHIELLFSTISGRNGFNNNPNVHQLKASTRAILLRILFR